MLLVVVLALAVVIVVKVLVYTRVVFDTAVELLLIDVRVIKSLSDVMTGANVNVSAAVMTALEFPVLTL